MSRDDDAARMELGADAWHQDEDGEYYIDCPECGSAATLPNVINHGRCNGYLDQDESDTEVDEAAMSCTANLALELVYTSDPDASGAEEAVGGE
ncbi:hypothetical protein [Halovivax limisalsi]|uniref:hypothetical protein n=1 Tax=Halovivax limisalsi TaxID=1453760 RepID=UPI001FFCB284|nr:hypothetical protein [Halovivax limisalsi]